MSGHLCPTAECARSHTRGWNDAAGFAVVTAPVAAPDTCHKCWQCGIFHDLTRPCPEETR